MLEHFSRILGDLLLMSSQEFDICDVPWVSLEERPPELELGECAEREPADHDHERGEEAREGEVALDLNTG